MRFHFQYLRFKTFPMTLRTRQCKAFWALLSNHKHSGVPEDSQPPTLEVSGFTPTLGQSGVMTKTFLMTPRTPKSEVFRPLLSNPKHSEVLQDSKSVATPLWPSVRVKPNTSTVGDLESSGTPKCSEFDSKTQNTSHRSVVGVIGMVLKRRYRKWPRIGHLDICNPSYRQKKGRESN